MINDERQLANVLREKLAPHYLKVRNNTNLASSRFYQYWKEWFDDPIPLAQPEIDLLLVNDQLWLLAAELKYFKKKPNGDINYPFYAGIGEALALLRFGFMCVSLWQFFDDEMEIDKVRSLYRSSEILIEKFDLPINYKAFKLDSNAEETRFFRLYYPEVQLEELPNAYGKPNPLRQEVDPLRIQDVLRAYLKIPHFR